MSFLVYDYVSTWYTCALLMVFFKLFFEGWHEGKPKHQGPKCQNLSSDGEFAYLQGSPDAVQLPPMLSQH